MAASLEQGLRWPQYGLFFGILHNEVPPVVSVKPAMPFFLTLPSAWLQG